QHLEFWGNRGGGSPMFRRTKRTIPVAPTSSWPAMTREWTGGYPSKFSGGSNGNFRGFGATAGLPSGKGEGEGGAIPRKQRSRCCGSTRASGDIWKPVPTNALGSSIGG